MTRTIPVARSRPSVGPRCPGGHGCCLSDERWSLTSIRRGTSPGSSNVQGMAVLKDPKALFDMLKETYHGWSEDKASRLAAALAYYTAFSVAPLLLIAIVVAGLIFGREAA